MPGSIAEVLGVGLRAGAVLMPACPLGRITRGAAAEDGMMVNAMMIDADVRITSGDICARDAGTRWVTRPTASDAQPAHRYGAAGGQGLEETGTPFVPFIPTDIVARGDHGGTRRCYKQVRPRGQRSGSNGLAMVHVDTGRGRGPPGRGLRQRADETSSRMHHTGSRPLATLTLHSAPGHTGGPGGVA